MTAQDPELSAALGWLDGISDPVLDRKTLLQMVAALRVAAQQALEALLNSRPLATEDDFAIKVRKHSEAITALRAALAQQAEPDHETRAELAEQQVVQLAEERDHFRNLWQKAQEQAEPVQEPVAKCIDDICSEHLGRVEAFDHLPKGTLLYTIFPRRTMVPLTEDEVYRATGHCGVSKYTAINIARAIERAIWEKNNGQA